MVKVDRLKRVLKEILRPFDCLLLVAAVFLFAKFDYDNLEISDIIYIVLFSLWFAMLVIRAVIMYNGKGGNRR